MLEVSTTIHDKRLLVLSYDSFTFHHVVRGTINISKGKKTDLNWHFYDKRSNSYAQAFLCFYCITLTLHAGINLKRFIVGFIYDMHPYIIGMINGKFSQNIQRNRENHHGLYDNQFSNPSIFTTQSKQLNEFDTNLIYIYVL